MHPTHARLKTGGPEVRRLLDAALAIAAPHESESLPAHEMVHSDLTIGNVLTVDRKLSAVVDMDGAGVGCAVYDLLATAVAGVSWASDPAAVERLMTYGIERYGPKRRSLRLSLVAAADGASAPNRPPTQRDDTATHHGVIGLRLDDCAEPSVEAKHRDIPSVDERGNRDCACRVGEVNGPLFECQSVALAAMGVVNGEKITPAEDWIRWVNAPSDDSAQGLVFP